MIQVGIERPNKINMRPYKFSHGEVVAETIEQCYMQHVTFEVFISILQRITYVERALKSKQIDQNNSAWPL